MYNNVDLDHIDMTLAPPALEPERQYYFIKKAKQYVQKESEKLGRPLTANINTFGCQMNLVTSI